MNKICTDLSQSQKLLKLGIPLETADMCWTNHLFGNILSSMRIESTPPNEYKNLLDKFVVRGYLIEPAWSLSALLELMPFHIIDNNVRYGFKQWKGFDSKGETYCFEYVSNDGICLSETHHLNNPIDACYEMIIKLNEQKLL